MQTTFLNIYPSLTRASDVNAKPPANIPNTSGLWLAHGDEPLIQQWLSDAMRALWHKQSLAIKRVELVSVKSWQDVLTELNSLSLFDDASAIIVSGNHKPDKTVQTALEAFALEANGGNNQNSVLWLTSKVDKRAQTSKWFVPFTKYGQVIDCSIYNENQRQQLLTVHAQHFGLTLTNEAWQFLMAQTEHHLLGAYQSLWRLSYLLAPQMGKPIDEVNINGDDSNSADKDVAASNQLPTHQLSKQQPSTQQPANTPLMVDSDALQQALVNNAHYTVFDLSEAMLAGRAEQVVKIVEQLKATDEPTPLALWAISKDMRLIMQLMDGQDPQSLGIWRNKQSLYRSACQRQTPQSVKAWSTLLFECDKAIKGLTNQSPWALILQAALQVAGVQLFSA